MCGKWLLHVFLVGLLCVVLFQFVIPILLIGLVLWLLYSWIKSWLSS